MKKHTATFEVFQILSVCFGKRKNSMLDKTQNRTAKNAALLFLAVSFKKTHIKSHLFAKKASHCLTFSKITLFPIQIQHISCIKHNFVSVAQNGLVDSTKK